MLAELLLGQPIFPGDSGVDQLVEIIKVLGTPTRDQIKEMNPNYTEFKFPQIKSHPWQKVSVAPSPVSLVLRHFLDLFLLEVENILLLILMKLKSSKKLEKKNHSQLDIGFPSNFS